MKTAYSEAFVAQALVKVFSRGGRTVRSVADDLNVNYHTVNKIGKSAENRGQRTISANIRINCSLTPIPWTPIPPSNDNAYAESVFRTRKYRPDYPHEGFATLDEARAWVRRFEAWYNTAHQHSGLNFVTPEQRHTAQAEAIMKQRIEVYDAARARNPRRWSRDPRDWSLPERVWLNPEKTASPQAKAA